MSTIDIRHFHLFCGLGGGAAGFNDGQARVGQAQASFRCIGGVDSDAAAIADFNRLAGVPGTVLDLFDRSQYEAWHGHAPPEGWRKAAPQDIQAAAHYERPHIVFTSPPCKGFSGLLSQARSGALKYKALNALTVRGIWLMLEAWRDDPPEFVLMENVPRIANRGRELLDTIEALLQRYGYATSETTHDCGELGGLGQSRRRFLLVARHRERVPPFLYQPNRRPMRSVGDVLGPLPLPGDIEAAGPMHRVPQLQWRTWVRLALVEAGSDWRSLQRLRVEDGVLADYGIAPQATYHHGVYGVGDWTDASVTISGRAGPSNGRYAIADPRIDGHPRSVQHGVRRWSQTAPVITGKMFVGGGPHAVADPRIGQDGPRFNNVYRVVPFGASSPAITAGSGPTAGGIAVADPRPGYRDSAHRSKFRVTPWSQANGAITGAHHVTGGAGCIADPRYNADAYGSNQLGVRAWQQAAGTITGQRSPIQGAFSIADPRSGMDANRAHYRTGGHYGVVPWGDPAGVIAGNAKHDRGRYSVADPRAMAPAEHAESLPALTDRGVYRIEALDGTWHRPFTTLECAALQGLVRPDEYLALHGRSDSAWRERIGNAVPRDAAAAIAGVMGETLLLAWTGETRPIDSREIWVQPLAVALAVHDAAGRSH